MQAGGRYAAHIMASRRNGALYVGVTNNSPSAPISIGPARAANSLANMA
jgi:hypothetical protein